MKSPPPCNALTCKERHASVSSKKRDDVIVGVGVYVAVVSVPWLNFPDSRLVRQL